MSQLGETYVSPFSIPGSNTGPTSHQRPDFKPIFSRLLPICVCFRGSAPDPAGGLSPPPPDHRPPDPQLGKIVHPEKSVTYFFFPNDMPEIRNLAISIKNRCVCCVLSVCIKVLIPNIRLGLYYQFNVYMHAYNLLCI